MRSRFAAFVLMCTFLIGLEPGARALAAPQRPAGFLSSDAVLTFINGYRHKPEPYRLPLAVQATSRYGGLRDPESAGVFVGFIAGVIGANPDLAGDLIAKSFPINPEDDWAIVRAIAHSGLPDWKHLLAEHAFRMPSRRVMIEKFIDGSLPTLGATVARKPPSTTERIKRLFSGEKAQGPVVEWALDASPEVLDMLWGRFFATGDYGPVLRIVGMLPWSKDRDHVDRLTIGAMAKYTLASNSARDPKLLAMLKRSARHQPKETAEIVTEITEAADTMQLSAIRKEAIGAIEDLKRKGPGSKRDMLTAGRIGESAIALGCIGAAATGNVALGLPCVVGGAVTSAALRTWSAQ
ncbi:MAG: hypothetical protein AB7V13_16455 [Pseudorhodoplanes sp.]|uniref:hypothetical protein n=1 Tax=Pseudorhodoplanes sp. TaxID=1934341 RepID=UPI003D12B244